MIKKHVATLAFMLATSATALQAAPLQVDLSPDVNRSDVLSHGDWENWLLKGGTEANFKAGNISVRLQSDAPFECTWWKRGYDTGATMASDGVIGAKGAALRLELSGLTPGPHTLTTFHNALRGNAVVLRATQKGSPSQTLESSRQTLEDVDCGLLHQNVLADASGQVVLELSPASAEESVVLNGLALDSTDPRKLGRRPFPKDGDEHALTGILGWEAAPDAKIQSLYFGENKEAVENAKPGDPCFIGHLAAKGWNTPELDPFKTYYWRVDQVDTEHQVTKGKVWSFRPRQDAFPGAQGHGRFALGGRGGRVLEVTNLNDSGPGSLRAAVEAEGPRIVVFKVGGVIDLKSKLIIRNPYITVAGQTAPGDGIAVHGYTFGGYQTHDVVIRHMRIRVGDRSGETLDGSGLGGCDHSIVDHCSIAWSIDEGFSSRGAKNITLQRSIIAEPLNLGPHRKYTGTGKGHAYAGSISGEIGSFHHNLLVHCAGRNWSLAGGLTGGGSFAGYLDIRNNVVYNWKDRTNDGGAKAVNLVGNYYIPGPSTTLFHLLTPDLGSKSDPQTYYVAGNEMEGKPEFLPDNWAKGGVRLTEKELKKTGMSLDDVNRLVVLRHSFCDSLITQQDAKGAYASVLADVGANKPRHDSVDTRVIQDVLKRGYTFKGSKGKLKGIIDSVADVGGYPTMQGGEPPVDGDHDGMPDAWELAQGLNPEDAADGPLPSPKAPGYTNVEVYLNSL